MFFFGLSALVTLLLFMPYSPKTNKQMFIEIKKDSLLKSTKSPRIIFIGGSNITLGLNSQLVKDSLKLNPINTGIIAPIGLKYMLKSSIEFVREDDIIIVIPEYHQFYGSLADGEELLLPLLFEVSYKFNSVDLKQYLKLSQHVPKYIASKLSFWNDFKADEFVENNLMGLQSYNIYGDASKHWDMPKPATFVEYEMVDDLNMEAFEILTEFKTEVDNKKAYLFISYPCFSESSFNKSLNQINNIENKLKELQIDILGTPKRYKFNDSLIFDTAYHLTYDGVKLRTELLIEDIKKIKMDREVSEYVH